VNPSRQPLPSVFSRWAPSAPGPQTGFFTLPLNQFPPRAVPPVLAFISSVTIPHFEKADPFLLPAASFLKNHPPNFSQQTKTSHYQDTRHGEPSLAAVTKMYPLESFPGGLRILLWFSWSNPPLPSLFFSSLMGTLPPQPFDPETR